MEEHNYFGDAMKDTFRHKLTRGLLLFMSEFCNVDLKKGSASIEGRRPTDELEEGRGNSSDMVKPSSPPVDQIEPISNIPGHKEATSYFKRYATKMVLFLYFYCTIRLLIYAYYQYKYDLSSLRLNHLTSSQSLAADKDITSDEAVLRLSLELTKDLNSSRAILQAVGAPYLNLPPLMSSCALVMHLVIAFFGYILGTIYFNYISPVDMYFVRLILDQQTERMNCVRMIDEQAQEFKNSSRNFVHSLAGLKEGLSYTRSAKSRRSDDENGMDEMQDASRLATGCSCIWSHRQPNGLQDIEKLCRMTERQLAWMQANELLFPKNRSPKWIHQTSGQFCLFSVANLIYSLFFDIALVFLVPTYLLGVALKTSPMDIVSLCDILILCEIAVISLTFYWSLFVANSGDQLKLINHIEKKLVECRHINTRELNRILSIGHSNEVAIIEESGTRYQQQQKHVINVQLGGHSNTNLLFAWMSYKMFIAQLRPIQQSFQYLAKSSVAIMFVMPIILRLHSVYFSRSYRLFATYMSLVGLVFADNLLIPMAELHYRGLRLYKSLFSLAAHSIECLEHAGASNIYDRHLIWLICKEIQQPDELTSQFATAIGSETLVTYPNLVQLHYWYSIILFSTFFDVQSWRDLIGSRFDDPLGIYQQV